MNDRRVHAVLSNDAQIVRYDRAGKWYVEQPRTGARRAIDIKEAVGLAALPTSEVRLGVPGGRTFDARVAAATNQEHSGDG